MHRRTILFIALGLTAIVAVGAWMATRTDPARPTARIPAGPSATGKASEEGEFNLPAIR